MIRNRVVSPQKPNEMGRSVPNPEHRKRIGSGTPWWAWCMGCAPWCAPLIVVLVVATRALGWW